MSVFSIIAFVVFGVSLAVVGAVFHASAAAFVAFINDHHDENDRTGQ